MKRIILGFIILYVGGYGIFRAVNLETWSRNGQDYVIYPDSNRVFYMLWRPLDYLDHALTGTGSHIGPHAEAAQ